MRHTVKSLQKLRSGQMVWRVLFDVERTDNFGYRITGRITPTWVMGKKILHWFRHHETNALQWSAMMVECKGERYTFARFMDTPNPMSTAHYLADLYGHGAFSSRRQAERFVREVEEGLHADVREHLIDRFEMDEMFDEYRKEYEQDEWLDLLDEADLGDEGTREPVEDVAWNESEGQGA